MAYSEEVIPANPFIPHTHLSEEINHNISQSEIEGGVFIDKIPIGACVRIHTRDHIALLTKYGKNRYRICGHPAFYPQPIPIRIYGSTWGGMVLKRNFIGRGMRFVFVRLHRPPDRRMVGEYLVDYNGITTAEVFAIEYLQLKKKWWQRIFN